MKIDRDYLPITAIAMNPKHCDFGSRLSHLTHLLVMRDSKTKGRLVAANGFMLAVVPVALDTEDVEGLVHPEALKAAAQDVPKREYLVDMALTEAAVVSRVGASYPRVRPVNGNSPKTEDYTDISRIVPSYANVRVGDKPATPLSFNFKYMEMLGKALGGCGITIWPNPIGPTGPIIVCPARGNGSQFDGLGMPIPPYGVLMPMHNPRAVRVEDKVGA